MNEHKFFGTDGIRGLVGQPPITPETILHLGWAAGRVLFEKNCEKSKLVLIGKDTRLSGYMLESALESGLSAAGLDVGLLGPMPTPGVAYLIHTLKACAGIVISASHNPYYDNGIKFFSDDGMKLSDDWEDAIEQKMEEPLEVVTHFPLGKAIKIRNARRRYISFCKKSYPPTLLSGFKIVLDCANGANYRIGPSVFSELGATVIPIAISPNGVNINFACGSTNINYLQQTVLDNEADLGIAFDGDGDRVIMVDHTGEIVDGDELLFIIAKDRVKKGRHFNSAVVGTQMSNLGLEIALKENGIEFYRANVGDRYVLEMMKKNKVFLGGESSGHIICFEKTTTGDAIIASLQVLSVMVQSGKTLRELKSEMTKFPQKTINVSYPPGYKADMESVSFKSIIENAESQLGFKGRVLLRLSGTEPVVRVMVEGENFDQVEALAENMAKDVFEKML